MRYLFIIPIFFAYLALNAQISINSTLGLPSVTTTTTPIPQAIDNLITDEDTANIGSLVYNTTDNLIYRLTGITAPGVGTWEVVSATDDQFDDEVPLRTPIDVNNVSGDPNAGNETTVQQVVQAITPITSKNGRVFYPPSIAIDASTNGNFTVNLYDEYVKQHTGTGTAPGETLIRSEIAGTPAPDIPIYAANELYYYVTFADPDVFSNISINGTTGLMSYTIIGRPVDFNSLINVVFVVK